MIDDKTIQQKIDEVRRLNERIDWILDNEGARPEDPSIVGWAIILAAQGGLCFVLGWLAHGLFT